MKKILFVWIFLSLTACSPVDSVMPFDQTQTVSLLKQNYICKPTKQMIVLKLPKNQGWKKVDLSQQILGASLMLIPCDASICEWEESVRTKMSAFVVNPCITMNGLMQKQIENAKKHCEQVSSSILSEGSNSLLYGMEVKCCDNQKNQREICRVFNGMDGVYLVCYTAGEQISKLQFAIMSDVIRNAKLVSRTHNPKSDSSHQKAYSAS